MEEEGEKKKKEKKKKKKKKKKKGRKDKREEDIASNLGRKTVCTLVRHKYAYMINDNCF